jgi:tetratricopeptide (TPR) repeat protein
MCQSGGCVMVGPFALTPRRVLRRAAAANGGESTAGCRKSGRPTAIPGLLYVARRRGRGPACVGSAPAGEHLRGQYRDAEAAFQSAQGLDPGFHGAHFWLGRVLAEQGRFDEALAELERRLAAPSANARVVAALAHTLAQMGRKDEARHRWLEFVRTAQRDTIPPLSLALAHLGLGEHNQALDCVEQACAARALPLYQIAVDPVFRPIRTEPRFAAVLRLMRLDDV